MGVGFYLSDPRLWNDEFYHKNYRLGVPLLVFSPLRDLLRLPSPYGDCTGRIATDALLEKIEAAQVGLQQHGREWERSPEQLWEGQEGDSLKVLGFPGITRDDLYECLVVLYRIACYARDHNLDVQWS